MSRTVFFDIDTQIDFVFPAGALYVPGAEAILQNVARLNRFAAANGIPLISTVDAHSENDPEFASWPPHCVAGTLGQRKPDSTLVGQIVLNKTSTDCFTLLRLTELLDELGATHAVVYGVVAEICVRHAALGLLERGLHVQIVTDAIKDLDPAEAVAFFAELATLGGGFTTCAAVAA